uniref:Uncharacterized protein LOC101298792 isoform X2 n=1 Tax=Rhizophora mucronata TaxID=61149 RepID=A0A2P2LWR1_RHIMU
MRYIEIHFLNDYCLFDQHFSQYLHFYLIRYVQVFHQNQLI